MSVEPTPTPTPTPSPTPSPTLAPPDLTKVVEDLLKKHGGDQATALRALLTEHNTTRDQFAAATTKLPKDGHVTLDPDTHKLFSTYQAFGKPEEITAKLEAGTTALSELTGIKRAQHFAEVAKVSGFESAVLIPLAEKDGLEITLSEVDGKDPKTGKAIKVKTASVVGKDAKGADTLTPLADYAKDKWAAFLPALQPVESKTVVPPRGGPTSANGPPRPSITDTNQPRRSLVR